MKILFTGDYLPDYNRTIIIHKGLEKLNIDVIELPFQKKSKEIKSKLLDISQECDFIFMPSFTHKQVRYVRSILPEKIIIFDPLISRYLTKIYDYKSAFRYGISAFRNYYRDKLSMDAADFVVTDTKAHLDYFNHKFKIKKSKMNVIYIGNNFDMYYPDINYTYKKKEELFYVGFYGGFIPLQGTLNILGAAQILKEKSDIQFELIGNGFEFEKAKKFVAKNNLTNVTLPGWVEEHELPSRIQRFDIALGIFGTTEKSDLVIPNKVYHYAACARPIITKRSNAILEIFKENEDLIFSETNPTAIADAIIRLKDSKELRKRIGINIYNKIKKDYNETQVAKKLIEHYSFISQTVPVR